MRRMFRTLLVVLFAGGAALAAVRPSPPQLRRLLDQILASGYRLEPPATVRIGDYLDWLLDRLAHWLGSWSHSGPLAGLPVWVSWVLFGVCVALLALLLAHMIGGVRSALSEPARGRHAGDGRRRDDPQVALTAAEAALARGDYESAVRLLYRAALLRLDRLGLLQHDPSRTNWENLAALRVSDPDLRADLTELTRAVDAAIYAGRPVTQAIAERCHTRVRGLWRAPAVSA